MKQSIHSKTMLAAAAGLLLLLSGVRAQAHCDTMKGPVVTEAQLALEKGDVTPVLKWVGKDDEAEIKAAFAMTLAVRAKGPEAKELADRYFLETLVRIHRAGEGAPYTGLKDVPVEPIVALADNALDNSSAERMIEKLSNHMAQAIAEKYNKALEARKHRDDSVAAGRKYVEAYVAYMHYIEGLHAAIVSAGGHEHAEHTD